MESRPVTGRVGEVLNVLVLRDGPKLLLLLLKKSKYEIGPVNYACRENILYLSVKKVKALATGRVPAAVWSGRDSC
ncbi:hypothetical protein E2C01_040761 [Portunus trituberculatus]|uniref:Uncharacterized protein n=1 Tax=Portunus trituberculatus TaxID=210409 RepID=A0A5B7FNU5_PORTR|nr:hypothetical protein [Portunus trituberculatus]